MPSAATPPSQLIGVRTEFGDGRNRVVAEMAE